MAVAIGQGRASLPEPGRTGRIWMDLTMRLGDLTIYSCNGRKSKERFEFSDHQPWANEPQTLLAPLHDNSSSKPPQAIGRADPPGRVTLRAGRCSSGLSATLKTRGRLPGI